MAKHRVLYRTDMTYRAALIIKTVRTRASQQGQDFDLDVAWLREKLENGLCELSGLRFVMDVSGRRGGPYAPSIDRIQPGGGYTKSNCRVILNALNVALSDLGLERFLAIVEALISTQRRRGAA